VPKTARPVRVVTQATFSLQIGQATVNLVLEVIYQKIAHTFVQHVLQEHIQLMMEVTVHIVLKDISQLKDRIIALVVLKDLSQMKGKVPVWHVEQVCGLIMAILSAQVRRIFAVE